MGHCGELQEGVSSSLPLLPSIAPPPLQSFSEPSSDKLLPDYLPHPYQRPYTLVLEMNDLLLHTSYDVRVVLFIRIFIDIFRSR